MTAIAGKTVLITGGASGIGRSMALELARLGAQVVIWDIHEENLNTVLGELARAGELPAHGYLCDVAKRRTVYEIAERVEREAGPVDILINNAGIVSGKPFLELSDEAIERSFAVNALALFWTTKAFLPGMVERNSGHVVNIASAAGWLGVSGLADYCASKFAAVGFDESLRVELKQLAPGVRTSVICPYYIDTGMFKGVKTRFSFLLPILREQKVALAIVETIRRDRPRLLLPPLVWSVPVLRALPLPLFDRVANALGINVSMKDFVGRD